MKDTQAEFEDRCAELMQLWEKPEYATASLAKLQASPVYRAIVALGPEILPLCMERLRAGDFVLARAALEILPLSPAELAGKQFPGEQEIAGALVAWWDAPVNILWTAGNVPASNSTCGVGVPIQIVAADPVPSTVRSQRSAFAADRPARGVAR